MVNDYIQSKRAKDRFNGYNSYWDGYLLEIAKKESDTKEIRRVSRKFIDRAFDRTYYRSYKSTFSKEEWLVEYDKLMKHYRKGDSWFIPSVADMYVEEKQTERLLAYLGKHLRCDILERYYKNIAGEFPDETIALFRQAVDEYMRNTGREVYENSVGYFGCMLKIKGGKEAVKQMIDNYKTQYKNRKAMMEIFTRFSKFSL